MPAALHVVTVSRCEPSTFQLRRKGLAKIVLLSMGRAPLAHVGRRTVRSSVQLDSTRRQTLVKIVLLVSTKIQLVNLDAKMIAEQDIFSTR